MPHLITDISMHRAGFIAKQAPVCSSQSDLSSEWSTLEATAPFTEWEEELVRYSRKHPRMRIIDSMDAIRPIMSRLSMLAPFDDHGIRLKVVISRESAKPFVVLASHFVS